MRSTTHRRGAITVVASAAWLVATTVFSASCGDSGSNNTADDAGAEGGTGFGGGGEGGGGQCQGIGCNRAACGAGPKTTITGQVLDPAGKNPIYNAIVYIPQDPSAPLPPLGTGVSCDKCGATALNPVVSTLTDENGNFTLTDVPFMSGVPVVVQLGKWRRRVSIDVGAKCAENKLSGPVKLPSRAMDGDMPQIAVTTGGADSLECLLLNIGLDQSEFVYGKGGTGHVHMFAGADGFNDNGKIPTAGDNLWQDKAKMSDFDILALSCEDGEHPENKNNRQAMHDYIEAGGRVFATHYHYVWFKASPQFDFTKIASWTGNYSTDGDYAVDETFPKGKSFAKWLVNTGASKTEGTLPLTGVTASTSTVSMQAQSWIAHDASNVKYFSFNAPIAAKPADQCGRVVFGDLHVSNKSEASFPGGCSPAAGAALTPQQKALEFLFWDLSSCIQSDLAPPSAPK